MKVGCIYNSFTDSPSGISITFFFPGCNLRCPYCYNKSLVELPGNQELENGLTIEESIKEIKKCLRRKVLTREWSIFSGGECTLYENELTTLINASKEIGQKTGIYSNCTLHKSRKFLLDLIYNNKLDFLNVDYKIPVEWGKFKINEIEYDKLYDSSFYSFIRELINYASINQNFTLRFSTVAVKQLFAFENYFESIKKELNSSGMKKADNISWRISQFHCDDYSNIMDKSFTKRNSYIPKADIKNILKDLKKDCDWNIEVV